MNKLPLTAVLALLTAVLVPSALADVIQLKGRVLRSGQSAAPRTELRRLAGGRSHYVLEFEHPLPADAAAVLAAHGLRVTSYLSGTAVAVAAEDRASVEGLGPVRASRFAAADKISPLAEAENAAAYLVEFHADVAPEDARTIVSGSLLQILEHPDLLPHQLLVAGPWRTVASLSEWDEVAYIFPAAADLVVGTRVVACAGALTEQGPVAQYVLMGTGWGPGELHYFFINTTARLDPSLTQGEMLRALADWARYAPLDFSRAEGPTAPRTISILFARGEHGDGYPFDGPGNVLAHTFYPAPPNREPVAGDMHLDEDEYWQVGATTDLYSVALHEAGHALGLGHSDRPGSVMYPYYRQATGLTTDDIAGIQRLYGSREGVPPPTNPNLPQPLPPKPPLSLTVVSPAAAAVTTTAAAMALSGRAENGTGTIRITWQSDRGPAGSASGGSSWSIAAVPLSLGANVISVTATDGAGARAMRVVTVTRQAAPPAAPPSLRITSPAFTIVSTSLATIALRGTASASASVVRWANSAGNAGDASGTVNWAANGIPLRLGSNTVTVRAFDAAGNSSWRSITVVRR